MRCGKCRNEAVFYQVYSGRHLCSRHLIMDIEARAKRSIRSHHGIQSGDHIAVVVSNDRKCAALLCFLKKLTADRRDIRLSALSVCEEDTGTGGRPASLWLAESFGIPCIGVPLPGESGSAGQESVTRIAMAVSLDDIAQGVLKEFLFGNVERLVHPSLRGSGSFPVICPFIAVPSDELDIYWDIEGSGIDLPSGALTRENIPQETGAILEDYTRRHPATKYALLHLSEQLSSGDAAATVAAGAAGPGTGESELSLPQKRPNI